jgi:hypothetical protein
VPESLALGDPPEAAEAMARDATVAITAEPDAKTATQPHTPSAIMGVPTHV